MNPRHIDVRRVGLILCAIALLSLFNEKHIWRWAWGSGYHALLNCQPVTGARGESVEAWRWVEGREIRIYTSTAINDRHVRYAAEAVRGLVDELDLDLHVNVMPPPPRVRLALANSTSGAGEETRVDFERLCREMITTRPGQYAEMVYAPGNIDNARDVSGAALFGYGVGLLNADKATAFTARHEAAHLLGYHLHDNWPLAIVGYSSLFAKYQNEPAANQLLMMPSSDGDVLSVRAYDALTCFWNGLGARTGNEYFRAPSWCAAPVD